MICRQNQITNCAKQAAVNVDFPVACWRDGAKHHPVVAQIAVLHQHWQPRADPRPQLDTERIIADLRKPAPPPALQQLREEVRRNISAEVWTDLSQLEQGLFNLAQEIYPRQRAASYAIPEAQKRALSERSSNVATLPYHAVSHTRSAGTFHILAGSGLNSVRRIKSTNNEPKHAARPGKIELLEKAQTAAVQGDMHSVWKVVKTLAPKAKRKQLQLYKEGHIMSPA